MRRSIVQLYDKWLEDFEFQALEVAGISTAIYSTPVSDKRETALFVHGVNGNSYGLIPLAYELRDKFNIVLVDLPSHGKSQNISKDIWEKLNIWSESLIDSLDSIGVKVDCVLAHSFGCYLVPKMSFEKTWLINPPAKLKNITALYARLAYQTRAVVLPLYNFQWFEQIRRRYMIQAQAGLVTQRLNWSLDKGVADKYQLLCQVTMMKEVLSHKDMFSKDYHAYGVVVSRKDAVVEPDLGTISADRLLIIDSGHLSVAESPELVARITIC